MPHGGQQRLLAVGKPEQAQRIALQVRRGRRYQLVVPADLQVLRLADRLDRIVLIKPSGIPGC